MNKTLLEKLKAIQEERTNQYGDADFGHGNLGLIWTGLLQNHFGFTFPSPIPAHVVLEMMAAAKCNRAVLEGYREDDFLDGINYLLLAEQSKAPGIPFTEVPLDENGEGSVPLEEGLILEVKIGSSRDKNPG